jgi:hypothetical protein
LRPIEKAHVIQSSVESGNSSCEQFTRAAVQEVDHGNCPLLRNRLERPKHRRRDRYVAKELN